MNPYITVSGLRSTLRAYKNLPSFPKTWIYTGLYVTGAGKIVARIESTGIREEEHCMLVSLKDGNVCTWLVGTPAAATWCAPLNVLENLVLSMEIELTPNHSIIDLDSDIE